MKRRSFLLAALGSLVLLLAGGSLCAQDIGHPDASAPSTQLVIRNVDGKTITFTLEEIAALPHKNVPVFNSHTMANER